MLFGKWEAGLQTQSMQRVSEFDVWFPLSSDKSTKNKQVKMMVNFMEKFG